jgi:hypothetical protein
MECFPVKVKSYRSWVKTLRDVGGETLDSPVFRLARKQCPQAYSAYMRSQRKASAFDVGEWNADRPNRNRLYSRNCDSAAISKL